MAWARTRVSSPTARSVAAYSARTTPCQPSDEKTSTNVRAELGSVGMPEIGEYELRAPAPLEDGLETWEELMTRIGREKLVAKARGGEEDGKLRRWISTHLDRPPLIDP